MRVDQAAKDSYLDISPSRLVVYVILGADLGGCLGTEVHFLVDDLYVSTPGLVLQIILGSDLRFCLEFHFFIDDLKQKKRELGSM